MIDFVKSPLSIIKQNLLSYVNYTLSDHIGLYDRWKGCEALGGETQVCGLEVEG